MKYLIVGLGNPGAEYENTRHNIGFKVVESISAELEGKWQLDKLAEVSRVKFKGRQLILIKPTT